MSFGLVFLLVAITSLIACTDRGDVGENEAMSHHAEQEGDAAAQSPTIENPGATIENPGATTSKRFIVKNATLEIEVESFTEARDAIRSRIKPRGGFIADVVVSHHEDQRSAGSLVVRLPAEHLEVFLGELRQLGSISQETVTSEEVTAAVIDLRARLKSPRAFEARLIELVYGATGSLEDLVTLEHELNKTRETIERYKAQSRHLESAAAMSTVTLHVTTREVFQPTTSTSFSGDLRDAFVRSWTLLRHFGAFLLIAVVALAPWGVAFGGPIWFGQWLLRRRRQKLIATGD